MSSRRQPVFRPTLIADVMRGDQPGQYDFHVLSVTDRGWIMSRPTGKTHAAFLFNHDIGPGRANGTMLTSWGFVKLIYAWGGPRPFDTQEEFQYLVRGEMTGMSHHDLVLGGIKTPDDLPYPVLLDPADPPALFRSRDAASRLHTQYQRYLVLKQWMTAYRGNLASVAKQLGFTRPEFLEDELKEYPHLLKTKLR